jgi:hypothetical protein
MHSVLSHSPPLAQIVPIALAPGPSGPAASVASASVASASLASASLASDTLASASVLASPPPWWFTGIVSSTGTRACSTSVADAEAVVPIASP